MDLGSLVGSLSGIILIIAAIFMAGDISNFWNVPGLMIVLGGTVSTTLLTFQLKDVITAFGAAYFVFTKEKKDPNSMVATMIKLSEISRRQGVFELSNLKTKSRFLKKACGLIADCSEEEVIRSSLRIEIESLKLRHFVVQDIFRKMGVYSPAFGMLGTLIGLVQMLTKLQDPSLLGPSMAIAILTTFYGSLLSTLLFLPIAGKLKTRTILEVVNLEIIFEGAISILDDNNPLIVYERLSSYIPASQRRTMAAMRKK